MRDLENIQLTGEEEAKLQYDYIEKAKKYVAEKVAEKGRPLTFCDNIWLPDECKRF